MTKIDISATNLTTLTEEELTQVVGGCGRHGGGDWRRNDDYRPYRPEHRNDYNDYRNDDYRRGCDYRREHGGWGGGESE